MRITIFGLTISSSWGNGHATPYRAILRALARMGHEVTFYEKDAWFYARHRDLAEPDFCRLVLYSEWDAIRKDALAHTAESDVVLTGSFLPEGARINDELLQLARPVKAYYDLDTPVTLGKWANGEPVEYVTQQQIAGFDLVFSFTGGAALRELEQRYGAKNARALYGCVDPDVHRRVEVPEKYRCTLSYMGTYAADRQEKVQSLFLDVAADLPHQRFVLAGPQYPWDGSITWPANLERFEHVSPGDHPALYSGSRATLNLTRPQMAANGYCPSGRNFEAAACGAALLSDSWKGMKNFFMPGEEIVIVETRNDVLQALAMPEEHLARMAARARQRTLDQHTGQARAAELLAAVESLGGGGRSMSEVA